MHRLVHLPILPSPFQMNRALTKSKQLINEWSPPIGSFGDSINSPFNYDSWEASAYDEVVETSGWEFIHGELIFTITNEDLE